MISKKFIYATYTLALALCTEIGYAAEFTAPTTSTPAKIVIQHALVTTASGTKHIAIHLTAKDNSNLHENQMYQAHFMSVHSARPQDGQYNEIDEDIFIPNLVQRGSAAQQTTLRLVNKKNMEFAVIESTSLSVEPEANNFFNPNSIHNVSNSDPE